MTHRKLDKRYACFLLLCLFLHGAARAGEQTVPAGRWRVVLDVPGGELPFYVDLERADSTYSAYLVNASERMPVDVRVQGRGITIAVPSLNSHIAAALEGDTLVGSLRLIKRGGRPQVIPLRAVQGANYRFFARPDSARIDVSGRWDVTFTEDEGRQYEAVGQFAQEGDSLSGTFLTSTGDYRFLEGQVSGEDVFLSCFDGGHAYLFKASWRDSELVGDFWSGNAWHESWRARRDETAELPDPYSLTYLKPGYDRFSFEFPEIDGREVSLDDARFHDKVVIVVIAGSWCRNCHDEFAFLSDYYKVNRERGVEVVALMYEHFRDRRLAMQQLRRLRERYDVRFPLLLAGFSDKQEASQTLPMLNAIIAFPTTIFIDRKGAVRRIRTGIDGPATGKGFAEFSLDFTAFVDKLLAE